MVGILRDDAVWSECRSREISTISGFDGIRASLEGRGEDMPVMVVFGLERFVLLIIFNNCVRKCFSDPLHQVVDVCFV